MAVSWKPAASSAPRIAWTWPSIAADGAMKLVVAGQDAVSGKAKGALPRQPAEDFCVGHDNGRPVGLNGELKPLQGAVSGLAVTTP